MILDIIRVIFVQASNECIRNVSQMYDIERETTSKYSLKVKRPVSEDKRKYIALSQLVSNMHHECNINESSLYHVIFDT